MITNVAAVRKEKLKLAVRKLAPPHATAPIQDSFALPHATAQYSDSSSAWLSTVWVAFSCLSGG